MVAPRPARDAPRTPRRRRPGRGNEPLRRTARLHRVRHPRGRHAGRVAATPPRSQAPAVTSRPLEAGGMTLLDSGAQTGHVAQLRDGAPLLIRPVEAGDRDLIETA